MTTRIKLHQTAGIVLVGAHPWTHSAFDGLLPRTLLPVAHRPLISYGLSWLQQGGIEDVAVCANRETQALQTQLLRHVPHGMRLSYHEDAMPRGAAGAVRDAANASVADTFVVTDGTAIPTVDVRDVLTAHYASGAAVTVVVHGEPGCHGDPRSQAPSGMYVFDRHALDVVPSRGFYDIKENLIPELHRSGKRVHAYPARSASPRVLNAASYLAANEWMVERVVAGSSPAGEGYVKQGDCLIHRDAVVAGDATFIGPVLVGAGARVMSGAVVVGPTSIGCEAYLGPGVLVSRSAIWRRSVVNERAVADRCVVADDTVVDAHTRAVRTVMVARSRREPNTRQSMVDVRERPSLEMLGKMIRYRLGAWSRSAAAE